MKNTDRSLNALISHLGLRDDFISELIEEDDWSFVIKLHALFEAACTHLLLYHFKEPNLAQILNRLPLSDGQIGKIYFLNKLELIGKDTLKYIVSLSELRNKLVHDIETIQFSFNNLIKGFDKQQMERFAISFSPTDSILRKLSNNPKLQKDTSLMTLSQRSSLENCILRAKKNPKVYVYGGAIQVLATIVDMYSYSDYKNWKKAKDEQIE